VLTKHLLVDYTELVADKAAQPEGVSCWILPRVQPRAKAKRTA